MGKKIVSIIMLVVVILSLTGCGAQNDEDVVIGNVKVENNAFNVTPQEWIDEVNIFIKLVKEDKGEEADGLLSLPDFNESGKKESMGKHTSMTYTTDDNGKLTSVSFEWYLNGTKEDMYTTGFLVYPKYLL